MDKNLKLFLSAVLAAVSFTFTANLFQDRLENYLVARELKENPPKLFLADISQILEKKQNSWQVPQPENCLIEAASALSIEIDSDGKETILFQKEPTKKMPIASLSKLMAALVAFEFYPSSYQITISGRAVGQADVSGYLKTGEKFSVQELLHLMLIESSNDAAFALSEPMGVEGFVALMNLKAKDLSLENSYFYNPTGLDEEQKEALNYSTAQDLFTLGKRLLKQAELLEIMSKKEYPLYLENGIFHHKLESTNELLNEIPGIVAGKTGFTEEAGGCLFLITENKKQNSYSINIVLNSPDRFADMRKLIYCSSFEKTEGTEI